MLYIYNIYNSYITTFHSSRKAESSDTDKWQWIINVIIKLYHLNHATRKQKCCETSSWSTFHNQTPLTFKAKKLKLK